MSIKTLSLGMLAAFAVIGAAAEANAGANCAPGAARYSAARPAPTKVAAAKPVAANPVAAAQVSQPAVNAAPVPQTQAAAPSAPQVVATPSVEPTNYEPVSAIAARLAALNARRPAPSVE